MKLFPLFDGSALLLAFEEWLTPDGHPIWHQGISPNIVVSLPPGTAGLATDVEKTMTGRKLRDSQDSQLLRALDLVTQSPTNEQ